MIKAIAYLRASDPRQDKSVEQQRVAIEERARADGAQFARWFVDDGLSGLEVESRPGLLALRRWVRENGDAACTLYAWAQSRLGRNPLHTAETLAILDSAGIRTRFLSDPEPDDEDARELLRAIRAQIDAQHSRRLRKDVPRGMRAVASEGRWPFGRPPFGYRVEHDVQRGAGHLVVEPSEAEVVRNAAELYLGGLGFKGVAARLTRQRVPPPSREEKVKTTRPAGMWKSKHVREMLGNPVYYGAIKYKGEVVCDAAHEAILDRQTWDSIQQMRGGRYRKPGTAGTMNKGEVGVVRPFLRCGVCGGPMKLNRGGSAKSGRIWYYTCQYRAENAESCRGINVRVDTADEVLLNAIESKILTPEALDRLIRDTIDRMGSTADQQARDAREGLQVTLDKLAVQLGNIMHAVALGAIQAEDARSHTEPLYAERDRLTRELAALPEPRPVPRFEDVDRDAFREAIIATWRSKDMGERRRAMDRLIDNIVLEPGSATISYSWKAEPDDYHHHAPYGPPYGVRPRFVQPVMVPGLSWPRRRRSTIHAEAHELSPLRG